MSKLENLLEYFHKTTAEVHALDGILAAITEEGNVTISASDCSISTEDKDAKFRIKIMNLIQKERDRLARKTTKAADTLDALEALA